VFATVRQGRTRKNRAGPGQWPGRAEPGKTGRAGSAARRVSTSSYALSICKGIGECPPRVWKLQVQASFKIRARIYSIARLQYQGIPLLGTFVTLFRHTIDR